jgi:hypothetical protein
MGSFHRRRAFDPLDLEIVDRIYEAAWAQIEAENANRDNQCVVERQQALREHIFAIAGSGPVDFDTLYQRVLDTASQVPQLRSGRSPA